MGDKPPRRPPPRTEAPLVTLPTGRESFEKKKKKKSAYDLRKAARKHTKSALKTILEIMNDPEQDGKTRLAAADKVLDRAWGKPTVKVADDDGKPLQIQVDLQLEQMFRRMGKEPEAVEITSADLPVIDVGEPGTLEQLLVGMGDVKEEAD